MFQYLCSYLFTAARNPGSEANLKQYYRFKVESLALTVDIMKNKEGMHKRFIAEVFVNM
jgi:hypothetical protein